MKSLLLVAHGSRRPASNDEVRRLADALRERAGNGYASVSCAFLELAEPSIPAGIDACVAAGASEIVVLPYFLAAGRHVVNDIPGAVAERQQAHPQVRMRITPYLGAAQDIPALLLSLVE